MLYTESKKIKFNNNPLNNYIKYLKTINSYSNDESSIFCPYDTGNIKKIKQLNKKYSFATNVILIGIGGSNLGTIAIAEALKTKKNLIVLDTLNSRDIKNIQQNKKLYTDKNTVVIIISKSGSTTETVVNAQIILQILPKLKKNTVFITDENSKLHNLVKKWGNDILFIPKKVGGRYSVFTAVGLLPLQLLEINIDNLIEGAKSAVKLNLKTNSIAYKNSLHIYKKIILKTLVNNYFLFNKNLETLGKWIVQLESESLGKRNRGFITNYSIGTNDLHSVYQLYLNGGINIYTNFVITNFESQIKIDKNMLFKNLVSDLHSKSLEKVFEAIYKGVKKSYVKNKLPFSEFKIELDEYSIGFIMQTLMIQTMYLGKLLKVNAFNQPAVEIYKEETRKILKEIK